MSLLAEYQQTYLYLQNYLELFEDMDDPAYVARGNGFCDSKFSEDFIDGQIAKYQSRLQELECQLRAEALPKPELRKTVRAMKKARTPQQLRQQSETICARLEKYPAFRNAKTVMLYASLPDEVQTIELIQRWRNRKQIILPTVVGDDIIPVELESDTQFALGDFNIPEPQNHPYAGSYDLVVVPGMAFDTEGNRLGRGKGYYDRFLAPLDKVKKIGVCFDFQRVASVPTEPTDIRMDEVISL